MSSSDEVLATIPVEAEPRWVAITPDGNRAYVTLTKDQPGDLPTLSGVAVIDTQTNTVAATITIDHRSNLDQPSGVVITPDGRRAYVSNFDGRGVVDVIDTAINTVIETIKTVQDVALDFVKQFAHNHAVEVDGDRATATRPTQ